MFTRLAQTGILVACAVFTIFLQAGCTTRQQVRVASAAVTDSIGVGRVRVTTTGGARIQLDSAFVRGDSIIGTENVARGASRSIPTVVPLALDSVRSIDHKRLDVFKTARFAAGIALSVAFIAWMASGAAVCC